MSRHPGKQGRRRHRGGDPRTPTTYLRRGDLNQIPRTGASCSQPAAQSCAFLPYVPRPGRFDRPTKIGGCLNLAAKGLPWAGGQELCVKKSLLSSAGLSSRQSGGRHVAPVTAGAVSQSPPKLSLKLPAMVKKGSEDRERERIFNDIPYFRVPFYSTTHLPGILFLIWRLVACTCSKLLCPKTLQRVQFGLDWGPHSRPHGQPPPALPPTPTHCASWGFCHCTHRPQTQAEPTYDSRGLPG